MITPKLLREWNACWNDERIRAYFGKRTEVTPREIAGDVTIDLDDRLWVLCRAIWYLDESAARLFAIESASLVAHLAGDDDDQAAYSGLLNDLLQIEDLPEEQRDAAWDAWDVARRAVGRIDGVWSVARLPRVRAGAYAWSVTLDAAKLLAATAVEDLVCGIEMLKAIVRALAWLGDYADGWSE